MSDTTEKIASTDTRPDGQERRGWAALRAQFDVARDPIGAVALFALIQAVVWTALPALVSSSPPLDVVEGLLWGQEWQLGYHKHPPLPPILVNIFRDITFSPIWGPYLLSQLCVGATFILVFMTARLVTTAHNAIVATVLLVGVYYFTWPTPEFNHNVAQLPVWAAAIYFFARIRAHPGRRLDWIWLGLVCGLGIYVKYSVVVLYLSIVGWALIERPVRRMLSTPWPWLGVVASFVVAAPHLIWLVQNDFAPLRYADARGNDGESIGPAGFLLAQLVNHAPLILVLGIIGPIWVKQLPRAGHDRSDLGFVAAMVVAPLAVTVILSAVVGIDLRDMWGMPMFTMSGLLVVMMLDRAWTARMTNRAFHTAVAITVIVAIAYAAAVPIQMSRHDRPRTGWPMARIARLADSAWRTTTGAPLRYVSGPMWLAGLVSAGSRERPHVVYDGDLTLSPWVSPDALERDGVLYIWQGKAEPATVTKAGSRIATRGSFMIRDKAGNVEMNYAVAPPKP